ncbi:hypothetical protein SAMN05444421_11618 [Celeribacter marinus]|nr:hypothetical protein SAMN05444421_11618 [Celeribacter marinus]
MTRFNLLRSIRQCLGGYLLERSQALWPKSHLMPRTGQIASLMFAHLAQSSKPDPNHATFSVSKPEIAAIRFSSVTSSEVNVRMIRPEYIAMMRSATCSTSGISELITITA